MPSAAAVKQTGKLVNWQEINSQIISQLDIADEYESLGLRIPDKSKVGSSGFISCHAIDRADTHPSAAINVNTGRYRDLGGSGQSLGFFDFAAKYGRFPDWRAARQHFAELVGMSKLLPKSAERPDDRFEFLGGPFNPVLCLGLCRKKTGVTAESIQLCGGRIARYPAKSHTPQYVVVFPAYGENLLDAEPRGFVAMDTAGGDVRVYRGEGNPPDYLGKMSVGNSGLVGSHAITHWDAAEVIYKVEGITDLLALQAMIPPELRSTHLVITNSGGTHETGLPALVAPLFAGKQVVVLHDADAPGQIGAKLWSGAMLPVAETVRNVQLPYEVAESKGKDLRDWIAEGHAYADLTDLWRACEPIERQDDDSAGRQGGGDTAATLEPHETILQHLKLSVVGELEESETIVIFSHALGKRSEIRNIDKIGKAQLIQKIGKPARERISITAESSDGSRYSVAAVREAIAEEAAKRTFSKDDRIGAGVWELNGRLILVNPRELMVINGEIEKVAAPVMEGKLIESPAEPWFDFDELRDLLRLAKSPAWCQDVIKSGRDLFCKWDNLRYETDAELLTALVCCTWVQSLWTWRPQVVVTGPTNSGKSMLIGERQCLHGLFGELGLPMNKPSAAGLRQVVGHTSKVITIDEFEEDRHRKEILEMVRVSSRGGQIVRGTSDQKGTRFGLKHILWMGGIESGMQRQADRNRCIMINLGHVEKNRGVKLTLPSEEELNKLGQQLLAVALTHWKAARELAGRIVRMPQIDIDHRIVESYSAPLALLAVVGGIDDAATATMLTNFLGEREFSSQQESDEERLLQSIFEAPVWGQGYKKTVGQMLDGGPLSLPDGLTKEGELMRVGIKQVRAQGANPDRLFFVRRPLLRILTETDFNGTNIDEILLRIPGAKRTQQRMPQHRTYGVEVPEWEIEKMIGFKSSAKTGSGDVDIYDDGF